jgi:hypothetical protein
VLDKAVAEKAAAAPVEPAALKASGE